MESLFKLSAVTLTELFVEKKDEQSRGIYFVRNRSEQIYHSYQDIYRRSITLLGYLQSHHMKPGDPLVFQLEDNMEFIHMFWACVLGGIIPVPLAAEGKEENMRKVCSILGVLNKAAIIGKQNGLDKLISFSEDIGQGVSGLISRKLDIDEAFGYCGNDGCIHVSQPDDTVFIQFSSGSTGLPKGVVLTHRNLLTNIDAIIEGAALVPEDVIVSWMPLTHDMGLIGCHLAVTAANMTQCSMETRLFIMRPALWLDKVTEHKATILTSPNFGLKYSLMAMERNKNKVFDFSSVRLIFNGAEPISVQICDEFLTATAKYGMKPNVMFPVYGMAEASLAIAFPGLHEQDIHRIIVDRHQLVVGQKIAYLTDEKQEQAACYVDEGYAVKHCEFRLTDETDQTVEEDTLGLIQIRGGNVTKGYYNNELASAKSFTTDGWFRTGDIGFMHHGRLVVVGRMQDVVIINGQNYFSNDLERVASEVKQVTLNKVAACAVRDDLNQEKLAVFVVHKGDMLKFIPTVRALREQFSRSLGLALDYIIPVQQIPKTSSGKLMRYVLIQKFEQREYTEVLEHLRQLELELRQSSDPTEVLQPGKHPELIHYQRDETELHILKICHEVAPEWNLGLHDNFFEHGIHSLLLNQIAAQVEEQYPARIQIEDMFTYSSVSKLAAHICGLSTVDKKKDLLPVSAGGVKTESIPNQTMHFAIIGIAAHLPGASNIHQFWANLCGDVESVGPLSSSRKKDVDEYLVEKGESAPYSVRDGGYLHEIDKFDHEFFRIMKREAIAMSPSQRLFMQTAYTSLEDAGYGGDSLRSTRTGVYVGYISDLDGRQYQDMLRHSSDKQTATGALAANISGRMSYFMDFKGPSILVDSACSSSMSALNLACQGISNGDCEQAIVGGVQLKVLPVIDHEDVGIESSDGHTRPFAEDADGTGEGEGVVSILVKPYDQAIRDKDQIYCIIRSIHSNQDGNSVGLSAPNPEAQAELVTHALQKASVQADDISYIEAHGTGTSLGDPIEIRALTKAFDTAQNEGQFCAIGSVKSNIGHLYAASGLVSVVKCALMLKSKMMPATVNVTALNPKIPFAQSPFKVNLHYQPWETERLPRRCGVSNFGFSGTNVHSILEEYVAEERSGHTEPFYPFVLSATSRAELYQAVQSYHEYLVLNPSTPISDICYTNSVGRGHYAYRLAILVQSTGDLIHKLGQFHWANDTEQHIFIGISKVVSGLRNKNRWGEWTADEKDSLDQAMRDCIQECWNPVSSKEQRLVLLKRICSLYVRGAAPEWEEWFKQGDVQRISLPTYRFQSNRCWPEFLSVHQYTN
ncbi:beta-ketoacyl synthase N-terminal-like domain-containing protein [Paenibacillus sp. 1781tsa1]|uniref:beta-ketoacyl synthase N-terminal-like domain-containing protein n=1 Tax=Paenibacillus sp. 1781tsa1 TaxID=2953810 RepID=UPI0020A06938|nr:beta-ketoacyl synthase N-terminal-like domain-containing protein [Paenibacillus sp. 1781tsa1]MCP1186778.1 AMP-binding protein [Paenibacillus sp. 1781tsa1]